MVKIISVICLCLSLLLSLTGCDRGAREVEDALSLSADRLAGAAASVTEEPAGEALQVLDGDDDGADLSFYGETIYGLAAGSWEDGALRRGTGVHAYEIAVFRFASGNAADTGEDLFRAYIQSRAGDFSGYAPEQAAMVKNGVVLRKGTWLGLFICPNPDIAGEVFTSALETGHLPSPATTSAPTAIPTPARVTSTPTETDAPHEISLREISLTPPEGDPDPQYPNRIRYISPCKEDMSLYYTDPILQAWETADGSALSPADLEIYEAARTLLDRLLVQGMTDLEKETSIYAWIVRNVNYDWTHADVTRETSRESYGPYGGLINRTAVCLGFASTFQLLMDMADVECVTVTGATESSTEEHAWNMVRLNGQWYCVDITWDANYREYGNTDGWTWYYFNVTSDYMARSDHQWDYTNIPEATATDYGMV